MKETGIIMSGDHPMKILSGTKIMTRRLIKPQPVCHCDNPDWHGQKIDWIGYKYEGKQGWFCYTCGSGLKPIDEWSAHGILCPYGQVSDKLWVRETHYRYHNYGKPLGNEVAYYNNPPYNVIDISRKDFIEDTKEARIEDLQRRKQSGWVKCPSRFMPRWASRILLEIIGVRVERLQQITEEDAIKEGCLNDAVIVDTPIGKDYKGLYARDRFIQLWDFINAERGYSWRSNPWVWVILFRLVNT